MSKGGYKFHLNDYRQTFLQRLEFMACSFLARARPFFHPNWTLLQCTYPESGTVCILLRRDALWLVSFWIDFHGEKLSKLKRYRTSFNRWSMYSGSLVSVPTSVRNDTCVTWIFFVPDGIAGLPAVDCLLSSNRIGASLPTPALLILLPLFRLEQERKLL